MKVEVAKRIWENEYKPSIQLLIDNGDTSYRPAMILIFCAIEHAYRAIHEIPEKEHCIEDAIRWAMPYYSKVELKERADKRIEGTVEWEKIDARIKAEVDPIREDLFNALKHVGKQREGIRIDGDLFGFMSGWLGMDDVPDEIDSQSFTIHIHGFWEMVVEHIDSEFIRKISGSLEFQEI